MSINLKPTYMAQANKIIKAFDSMCEGIYTNMFERPGMRMAIENMLQSVPNLCEGTRGGGSGMSSSRKSDGRFRTTKERQRGSGTLLHTISASIRFTCLHDAVVVSAFAFLRPQINLNLVY